MQIKMDTDQVRAMAGRLRQTADSMDTHLASIKQSVTSAGWQSQAREEFIIQLETLKRSTDQSSHVLRLMAQAAEEKATQWEAIANVFNGPFYFIKGIWNSVRDFISGLGSAIENAINNIKMPTFPNFVLPSISGSIIIGGIDKIIPDWDWKKPHNWWGDKSGFEEGYSGGGSGGAGGGSWGGESDETSSEEEKDTSSTNQPTDINYNSLGWSDRIDHLNDYRKELKELEANSLGNSERAHYLKSEINKIENMMKEGITPDGPTPKANNYTGCTNYVAQKRDISGFKNEQGEEIYPDACDWNDVASKSGYDVGKAPVKGSIMVIEADGGEDNGIMKVNDVYGHVVYVEDVKIVDGVYRVTYSHGGWKKGIPQGTYIEQPSYSVDIPIDGHQDVSFIY